MKIAVGNDAYLEPDEGPRDTPFHMRIVRIERIPNTRVGNNVTLECGHGVQTFGNLAHAEVGGVVRLLCTKCRDLAEGE